MKDVVKIFSSGAAEMTQSIKYIKCLPCKSEDLSTYFEKADDSQHLLDKACNPCTDEAETSRSLWLSFPGKAYHTW